MKQIKLKYLICYLLTVSAFNFSCKKFVEVDPPINQLVSSVVFEDDLTATAAASGIYGGLADDNGFTGGSLSSLTFLGAYYADELEYTSNTVADANAQQFQASSLLPSNTMLASFWDAGYRHIYRVNALIEGIEKSTNLTPALKKQLMGEGKFLRAFLHFYLVNLYGDIPYIKTTDYLTNSKVFRMPIEVVYSSIISDLTEAKSLLTSDFTWGKGERTRPNRQVVTALLSRVYLYHKDWANAELQATEIINQSTTYSLDTLNGVFLKNSKEAIWQFMPVNKNYTNEGQYSLQSTGVQRITNSLFNSFESGDKRKVSWIIQKVISGTPRYVSYKYKDLNPSATLREYSVVFRLGELYLIRSEARAHQGNLTGINSATSDLNIIRNRAGLGVTAATTMDQILIALENERRWELFVEWGHRLLDLKRTDRATTILQPIKPLWSNKSNLFPLTEKELLNNQNLSQNPGY